MSALHLAAHGASSPHLRRLGSAGDRLRCVGPEFSRHLAAAAAVGRVSGLGSGHRRASASAKVKVSEVAAAPAADTRRVAASVEIPVNCYQILGISEKAEKDEIVKAAKELKNTEIEDGYTVELTACRQDLLTDVRDKLLFEQEYAGNVREKIPPRSSIRIPWSWLPAALCLLQEVGEEKMVLGIGREAWHHPEFKAKAHIHDLLLAMALSECSIAKTFFEKNKVSNGFEALARAQHLLRSEKSLKEMPLLGQIEESLEELAPACALEILSLPPTADSADRRHGAIKALRELIRQGLDSESSCRVLDWPSFLDQAMKKLTSAEIVELLSWDTLAETRKNKKSLESQSQRVVVDYDCFYVAMLAHIAYGFSTRQTEMIGKAKTICECLVLADNVDLKLELSFCLYLLGQENGAAVLEKLQQIQTNGSSKSQSLGLTKGKEENNKGSVNCSLELWLKDAVLSLFQDTQHFSPSLANFFGASKRTGSNPTLKFGGPKILSMNSQSAFSNVGLQNRIPGDQALHTNSSKGMGEVVKQLSAENMDARQSLDRSVAISSAPLQRNPELRQMKTDLMGDIVGKLSYGVVVGFILFGMFKFLSIQLAQAKKPQNMIVGHLKGNSEAGLSGDQLANMSYGYAVVNSNIWSKLGKLSKLLWLSADRGVESRVSTQSWSPVTGRTSTAPFAAAGSKRQAMVMEEAETLVKQWQAVKSEALGPNHQFDALAEILDESMLSKWLGLAKLAHDKSCFWRFVLLNLSVVRAEVSSDEAGHEMAEIEAVLEEAAELVDDSHPKKSSYYSTYEVQYKLKKLPDKSWRICNGVVRDMT